jgi:ankyrin repeat protein
MRNLALNCLTWTIYARRPLRTDELQHALAIYPKCTVLEDLQIDSSQVILEACGNLLEEVNGSIRPIHYTVQEFFTTKVQGPSQYSIHAQLLDSNSVHRRLSLACLEYVKIMAFDGPADDDYELYERLRVNEFAAYACQSFDFHVFNCEGPPVDVTNELETLLQQGSAYLAALLQIRVLNDDNDHFDVWGRFNPMSFLVTPSTVIYSTSLYNVPTVRQRWVDETLPTYAMHLAASAGLMSAVVRLLEGGGNVNEKDGEDCTPLYYTCLSGNLDIAELLIENCADVNAQGGYYGTALQAASTKGHEQIVKLLLENKAEVDAQGGEYNTALQAASTNGHEQIVKLLLENKAEVDAQGGEYNTALQAASTHGHEQVVRLLLNNKAEVNAQGGKYGSALQAASYWGHEQVVRLLLDNKAEVNAQGGEYGSALQAASRGGHEQVVRLLLDHEADVDALGVGGHGTALEAASENGHERVVKLLLDHKADIHGDNGGLAVLAAVWIGHKQIVKLLLDYKADVKGDKGKKALRVASRNGHEQIVKLLRDAGADEPDEDDLVSTS